MANVPPMVKTFWRRSRQNWQVGNCRCGILDCASSKAEFERKIQEILLEARERLDRRKLLTSSGVNREIEYFYQPKDEDED